MSRTQATLVLALVALGPATPAWAQKSQAWIPLESGAVTSRVVSCANPTPFPLIALDDFKCDKTGFIRWIQWWGVVLPAGNTAQLSRKYYIAIRSSAPPAGPCADLADGTSCDAGPVLASWCVTPSGHSRAGKDCLDRQVYRLNATLDPPFIQYAGTHYWIQISESDADSVTQGSDDFLWSTVRPVTLCSAHQTPPLACAINDDCTTQGPVDMTFWLRERCLPVVVGLPPAVLDPRVFIAEFRLATLPLNSPPCWWEALRLDESGVALLDPPLPDGQYNVTLIGMGVARPTRQVTLTDGAGTPATYGGLMVGDLDNNGNFDGEDIPLLVGALLLP